MTTFVAACLSFDTLSFLYNYLKIPLDFKLLMILRIVLAREMQ